jgi:hypothetical protein
LSKGNYFGEVALLTNKRRAATVTAVGLLKCVGLNRQDFTQLMGPCDEILKRNMENYKSYEYYLKNRSPYSSSGPTGTTPSSTGKKKRRSRRKKATAESKQEEKIVGE